MREVNQQVLLDAIVADPGSLGAWEIYADWLLDRGDPRGELINLELAVEGGLADPDATHRIHRLVTDEEALLSPRLLEQSHYWYFTFWRSFIKGAEITGAADDPPGPNAIAALFDDPHACLIASITLGSEVSLYDALVAAPRGSLRELAIGDAGEDGSRLDTHLPALEELQFFNMPSFRSIEHTTLRRLTLDDVWDALANGNFRLPNLEELVVPVSPGDPMFSARSILSRPPPRLAKLWLSAGAELGDFPGEIFANLVTMPALSQLTELSLGSCSQDFVTELIARPDAFRHLATLELVLSPYVARTADDVQALRDRVERALPRTTLDVNWDFLLPREASPELPPRPIDTESRGPDGRVDAIGAFSRRTS